jgi:peptide/nickel transport system permease protein
LAQPVLAHPAPPGALDSRAGLGRRIRTTLRDILATPQNKVGALLLIFFVGVAVVGAIWNPRTETSIDLYAPVSRSHLLGTDSLGRDILLRTISGSARIVGVSFLAAVSCVTIGSFLGALIAYRRGLVELFSMRTIDVILSFPSIISALLAAALLPPGYLSLFVIATVLQVSPIVRVSRGIFADIFARDFISVAILRGDRIPTLVVREALPNVIGPILVELAIRWSNSLLLIAALNFLGVGVQPPAADWGLMLQENRVSLAVAPWSVLAPAVALAGLAIGINFTADGIARVVRLGGDVVEMAR